MPLSRTVLTLAAFAAAAVPSTASAAGTLQPGARMQTPVGSCTMNFAYTDGTSTYLGSAAHCVEPGQEVADADGDIFGKVALRGDPDSTIDDYSFIKVDAEDKRRVSPQVKGHPGYPTGVTTPAETRFGDTLQVSGYGLLFDTLALTRERRVGVLASDDEYRYRTFAPILFGDSGGPIVHQRTGKALGIISRLCVGLCTEEGPTVQGILAFAAKRNLHLTLLTR